MLSQQRHSFLLSRDRCNSLSADLVKLELTPSTPKSEPFHALIASSWWPILPQNTKLYDIFTQHHYLVTAKHNTTLKYVEICFELEEQRLQPTMLILQSTLQYLLFMVRQNLRFCQCRLDASIANTRCILCLYTLKVFHTLWPSHKQLMPERCLWPHAT